MESKHEGNEKRLLAVQGMNIVRWTFVTFREHAVQWANSIKSVKHERSRMNVKTGEKERGKKSTEKRKGQ